MTSKEIRQHFFDFFESKQHKIVGSAPIVVKNDPTLMFTNAGMNQFKEYFLSQTQALSPRVANSQRCLRVSGKHNDLEEVGVDTYHHTMFEMLGNWSFGASQQSEGGYFKKEAIAWSWELLTEVYKIPKDKLYVTFFEGDEKENLPKDEESYQEWEKYIDKDRILPGNKKDNFWEMGDTGPCGPCTEIHVDCRTEAERKSIDGKTLVNNDHPQVIEIWNNVFMQYNRLKNGSLELLPARHVDTGMGFERLVRVLQNKPSNYDTDIFAGLIAEIEKITQKKYDYSDSKEAVAFRVLADHIRAISFTIADGQLPSNTGAGYVIRRILRRAARYYYSYLNCTEPLLYKLVDVLAAQFSHLFTVLEQQKQFVQKVIKEEEETFLKTLEKGLKKIDDLIKQSKPQNIIPGADAFELYDTYGFPPDLTMLIAAEQQMAVDMDGFEAALALQKNRSRNATQIDAGDWVALKPDTKTNFVGYDDLNIETAVVKYRKITAKGSTQYQIILESTPFYAESGGQVGDKGSLIFGDETIDVTDTKKENDLIVHFTNKLPQNPGEKLTAKVNWEQRLQTMYNHTATHLLHAALRQVLGSHVAQKGSLVNDEYLRFDFSHFTKLTDDEIRQVHDIVNEKIRQNLSVAISEMDKSEALKLGAMALFGEKYGDKVRVVTIDPQYSIELCGGTHVPSTGMIGLMMIQAESAVAAGVRRIEALTGVKAFQFIRERVSELKNLEEVLKSKEPLKALDKLIQDKAQLENKLAQFEAKHIAALKKELAAKAETLNGAQFISGVVELDSADALKKLCADFKDLSADYVCVLAANIAGKASVAIGLSQALADKKNMDASKFIKEMVAPIIKGGGGGQKTLATAGGQDASNLPQVIAAIRQQL